MKNTILTILIGLLLTSCYTEIEETAGDGWQPTISKEKMIDILTDLQLIQSAMKYRENAGQNINELNIEYHQKIFNKYEISKAELDKNLEYYKSNIKEFDEIYEKVIENLSRLESEIKTE